jgi:hypothetical protein
MGDPRKRLEEQLPEGWVIATNIETHLSILDTDDTQRSIAAFPHPRRTGWRVLCLANYSPECPRIADDVSLETAVDELVNEAEKVNNGNPTTNTQHSQTTQEEDDNPETDDRETQDGSPSSESDSGNDPANETDSANTVETETESADEQLSFDDFQ